MKGRKIMKKKKIKTSDTAPRETCPCASKKHHNRLEQGKKKEEKNNRKKNKRKKRLFREKKRLFKRMKTNLRHSSAGNMSVRVAAHCANLISAGPEPSIAPRNLRTEEGYKMLQTFTKLSQTFTTHIFL